MVLGVLLLVHHQRANSHHGDTQDGAVSKVAYFFFFFSSLYTRRRHQVVRLDEPRFDWIFLSRTCLLLSTPFFLPFQSFFSNHLIHIRVILFPLFTPHAYIDNHLRILSSPPTLFPRSLFSLPQWDEDPKNVFPPPPRDVFLPMLDKDTPLFLSPLTTHNFYIIFFRSYHYNTPTLFCLFPSRPTTEVNPNGSIYRSSSDLADRAT